MLKINKKLSAYISIALAAVTFLGLIFFVFYLPTFTGYLIGLPDNTGERASLTLFQRDLILAEAYAILLFAFIGDGSLFVLLLLVLRGKVFTELAVGLIRTISWCLILIGIVFFALTAFFTLSVFVGFAVGFIGLTIRVVKNVIEEAVSLKEENDLTV